jgi:hypothetical protein
MKHKKPSVEAALRAWEHKFHGLDIRLSRLENTLRTRELLKRLPPRAWQHVEVF